MRTSKIVVAALPVWLDQLITEDGGQHAFPSLTVQKTASFSLTFRPKSH
jgi:hypothetical protein